MYYDRYDFSLYQLIIFFYVVIWVFENEKFFNLFKSTGILPTMYHVNSCIKNIKLKCNIHIGYIIILIGCLFDYWGMKIDADETGIITNN